MRGVTVLAWPYVLQCQHKFHSTFDMTTIKSSTASRFALHNAHSHCALTCTCTSQSHTLTLSLSHTLTLSLSVSLAGHDNLKSWPHSKPNYERKPKPANCQRQTRRVSSFIMPSLAPLWPYACIPSNCTPLPIPSLCC